MMTQAMKYSNLKDNLNALGMKHMSANLDDYLDDIQRGNTDFLDILMNMTEGELKAKEERHINACVKTANFPFLKTLDDFDFDFQPSVNRAQICGYTDLRFIDAHQNIILVGSSGTGKTHIATALGIEAAKNGKSTYFIDANDMILQLRKATLENRLEERLKHFSKYKLLIIDDIGYVPIDNDSCRMLYQLIARRHGKKSTIITSNTEIRKWVDSFSDAVAANAIFDRLADFESPLIRIIGPSYRTRHLEMMREVTNDK